MIFFVFSISSLINFINNFHYKAFPEFIFLRKFFIIFQPLRSLFRLLSEFLLLYSPASNLKMIFFASSDFLLFKNIKSFNLEAFLEFIFHQNICHHFPATLIIFSTLTLIFTTFFNTLKFINSLFCFLRISSFQNSHYFCTFHS